MRDEDKGVPDFDVDERLEAMQEADIIREGPQLKDLTETLMEGREEALVKSLFRQIREQTVTDEDIEESRPNVSMHEEPPDIEDMEPADWTVPAGCVRVDAEGQPISIDLLVDVIAEARRKGNYPRDNGWEFWLHHEQLNHLRESADPMEWYDHAGTPEDLECATEVHGIPVRAFPVFPKGAVLLLDPAALEPQHGLGSRTPQGVTLVDPRRVARVTGIGRPD